MSVLLGLALLLSVDEATLPAPVAAVDACVKAHTPAPFDPAKIVAAGWTEGEISGIEKAPGGAAGNRMFTQTDAGAVIVLNTSDKSGEVFCHVIFRRSMSEVDSIESAIGSYFGEPILKLGPALTMFRTPGRPVLVSLSRKAERGKVLADVAVMPFKLKESAETGVVGEAPSTDESRKAQ